MRPPPVIAGIPVAQPYVAAAPPVQYQVSRRRFSTGLCDCSDTGLCCLTCLCPCITFGRIVEIVDRGSTSCGFSGALYGLLMALGGWQWIYSCTYRSKLRAQYGMPENGCLDCWIHCWCGFCALCQEYRELQLQGYDPALGWHGNMERQSRGMLTSPTIPGSMIR